MAPNNFIFSILVLVLLLDNGVTAYPLCKIDTTELGVCRPAVAPPEHGQPLPLPTDACCSVVRRADLKCLCSLKSALPSMGINPANALALPAKCGTSSPPECHL
ncbi:unnamed protein product [Citrullus colocynthis]|uniref:Bifunctional inhibitor/plant lipid transfer protein/seed storage helical domain-containing protein n=1 Tax=Citrullus colocynthis TaxID=252529 RepID=A0ABP0XLX6_9ROSI